jgi:hypothetical protein
MRVARPGGRRRRGVSRPGVVGMTEIWARLGVGFLGRMGLGVCRGVLTGRLGDTGTSRISVGLLSGGLVMRS